MKKAKYCYPVLWCLLQCCLFCMQAQAQKADTTRKAPAPKFLQLNYEEDYRYLAHKSSRTGLWQKLKYIPLYPNAYLTIGGELRPRLELREHLKYGKGAEDEGFDVQQRSRLWADIHFSPSLRLFGELQSGTTPNLDYPASPIDNNEVELHQAFAEFSKDLSEGGRLFLRAGRQEILFGKSRLFDVRQPPNNRHSFDAARAGFTKGKWSFGLLAGAEVADNSGSFNDGTNEDFRFAAGHVSYRLGQPLANSAIELLYIYTDRKAAPNAAFVSRRNTVSARIASLEGGVNYDAELIGQLGHAAAGGQVSAWYFGSESFYTFSSAWRPSLGIRVDVGSGDKDSTNNNINSYDFLWSRGQSWVSDLGYTNLAAVGPTFGIKPLTKLSVDMSLQGLWRLSKQDGIYAMSGVALRRAPEGTSSYVGLRSVLRTEYQVNPFLTFGAYVNSTFKGSFLQESGSSNLFYGSLYGVFRF